MFLGITDAPAPGQKLPVTTLHFSQDCCVVAAGIKAPVQLSDRVPFLFQCVVRKKTSYKDILLKNQCEPQAGVNLLLSSLIPEWQSSCRKDL
ncbi:hypothetical protein EI555_006141 [Monodon monoceros]|uniref:Uncharacterized protein n=1 Tax=Monodon monoceros TaxID=40151 RepID=A0A4U1ELP8_MONMO|nr:hypothetical protein EI555_006141 [Monodon monoceros]